MIPRELQATILRLYHAEKWPVGTIAQQLEVHHSVVKRVLAISGVPRARIARRSKLDAYVPFIHATLRKYPRLAASRLWWMARERGCTASEGHFRRLVARLRPKPPAEAYLRLRTAPGEQGQVDWGHFGKLRIGQAERKLMAFVLVLSYSRRIFLRFYLNQQIENFLRGHDEALRSWNGCPRVLLYDNLKSVVLERYADAIRFHPLMLAFAEHWRFEPRPVNVARGNEKGRVERAIRYIRTSFFAGRSYVDLVDLNAQADAWCAGVAMERPWPEDRSISVAQAFEREQEQLLAVPERAFELDERVELSVGKTPYVRFDRNDYSVPHEFAKHTVTVFASLERVRIVHGGEVIADHPRSFSKEEQIEDPEHLARLIEHKRGSRRHRGIDRLHRACPSVRLLMTKLAERGHNLGAATSQLLRLLAEHGTERLEHAIAEVVSHDVPHPHAVRQLLEQRRRRDGAPPRMPVHLPDDPAIRDLTVKPHDLRMYDRIFQDEDESSEDTTDEPQ